MRIYAKKRKYGKYAGSGRSKRRTKPRVLRPLASKGTTSRLQGSTTAVDFHYSTRVSLNPGVGGLAASQVFRLSSIHDPDFSGIGHQPVGHDQFAALYERYQVYEIEYHVEYVNRDAAQNQAVGVRFSDVSTVSTDRDVNIENGYGEWALLGSINAGPRKFTGKVFVNSIHGVSYKQYMSNDDYGANFGSNPVEEAYMIMWADGLGDDSDAVDAVVHIVYKTKVMGSQLTALS